jgi:hypothetical protein
MGLQLKPTVVIKPWIGAPTRAKRAAPVLVLDWEVDWQHWTGPVLHWETDPGGDPPGRGLAVTRKAKKAATKRATLENIFQASVDMRIANLRGHSRKNLFD